MSALLLTPDHGVASASGWKFVVYFKQKCVAATFSAFSVCFTSCAFAFRALFVFVHNYMLHKVYYFYPQSVKKIGFNEFFYPQASLCFYFFFLHSRGAHPIVAMGAASRDNE